MMGWAVLSGCRPTGRRALLEGDRFLQAGRLTEAVPMLERAAADLKNDGAAWNHLGRAYHESGRITDARKAYLRALQADRNLFDAHFNLGQLALESGAWRDAEAGFRTWLGAGQLGATPANVVGAWRGLGIAQLRQGNAAEAERSFGSALRVDDKDVESWNAVGLIRQQRRQYRDAFNAFAYAARLSPQFAAPRLNAAIVAQQYLNDRRTALEYYRAYLALNPPDAAAISQLIAQLEPKVGALTAPSTPATEPTNSVVRTPGATTTGPASTASAETPPVVKTPQRTASVPAKSTATSAPQTVAAAPTNAAPAPVSPPERRPAAAEIAGPTASSPPAAKAPAVTQPVKSPTPTAPDTPTITRLPPPVTSPSVASTAPSPTPPSPTPPSPTTDSPAAPPRTPPAATPVAETTPALPPATVPAPPVEVIQVAERPIIRPAQAPIPAPTVSTPAESVAVTTETPPIPTLPAAAENPVSVPTTPAAGDTEAAEPAKRSLLSRANPLTWFKRDQPAANPRPTSKQITPLEFPPTDTAAAPPAPVVTPPPARKPRTQDLAATKPSRTVAAVTPTAAAVIPPPPVKTKPVFERYTRQVSAAPARGDRSAAIREFETALAAHRDNDLPAATRGYQKAVELDPAYFEAQYNLSLTAVSQSELPVALRAAETAIALRPTDVGARYQYAVALQRSRHPAEAAAELEEVARLQQTNSASHLAVATLYANDLQEPDRARAHYEKVLSLDPAHPQADTIRRWLAGNPAR